MYRTTSRARTLGRTLTLFGALAFVTPVSAQADGPPGRSRVPESWRVSLGLAPIASPVYEGADAYGLSVFPDIRLRYRDRFFASVPNGIFYRAWNGDRLKAGPIARIRFGREEDQGGSPFLVTGSPDGLTGLGDVDAAMEIGAFASYRFGRYLGRAELRRGFGGHDGVVGDLSLDLTGRAGALRYAIGPRVGFGSADFLAPYFGVNAVQSAATGLSEFDADGGINRVGVGANAILPRGRRTTWFFFAGYNRLVGDAADAPLVSERGSPNQLTVGASVSWSFDLPR